MSKSVMDTARDTLPRPRPAAEATSTPLDERMLVGGYLAAVANRLTQRGILVGEIRAGAAEPGVLAGLLRLVPLDARPERWAPTQLEWGQDSGWSATLLPAGDVADQRRAEGVQRYLPRQLVPAPDAVAHFAAALIADEHTIWASAIFRQPRRADRRWLIMQLSRFASPQPWRAPAN